MLRLLIEKEIRDIIGSTKFIVMFSVCLVLICLSFLSGVSNFKASQTQYDTAKAASLKKLDGMTDWLQVQSTRIFLPPQPLAVLVSGVSNDLGRTIEVAGRGDLVPEDSKYSEEPVFAIFRFLDLEFLFQIVLSLFAILLGYDALSGEKERGTLRLTFANSVSRATFILGKLIGSSIALAVPLICAIFFGSLILILFGIPMSGGEWFRLALIVLVGVLYLIVIMALSIFLSAITQRSSSSLLASLIIWVLFIAIIPRVSVLLAARSVNVPSLDEINAQKQKYSSQLRMEDLDKYEKFSTTSTDPNQMSKDLQTFMSKLAEERNNKMNEFGGKLDEQRYNKQTHQEHLALGLARISPATSFSVAIASLAGTALDLKNQFHNQALAYQQEFRSFMKEKTGMASESGMRMIRIGSDPTEKPTLINVQEMPSFKFSPLDSSICLSKSILDIGLLLLFGIVFFGGAFYGFYRYDLR